MTRYRKVNVRMWGDEKYLDLSDKAMLLFDFLLTGPQQTSLGAMRATVDGLASEFLNYPGIRRSKWSSRTFRTAFREISDKKMVLADEKAPLIWLPNFLKHNQPANPNVVRSWPTVLETLPECETRARVIEHILGYIRELDEKYDHAFREAFRESFGNDYLNSLETVGGTVSKQLPKQFPIQEQQAGTGCINRKQEQEHGNPHPTPQGLSETISQNNALPPPPDPQSLVDKFNENWNRSWDWWKARLENIQIEMWGTISLKDEQLLLLIEGEDGTPGFEDPAVLYLAIAQTKKTPNAPFRYLQIKAKDQITVHMLRKKADCMKDEDF